MPISTYHDEATILQNSINILTTDTSITQLTPGAKARALLEAFARENSALAESFDLEIAQAFVRTATNTSLDYIGEVLGVSRLPATKSQVSASHNNIKFYVISGTFGDITGGVSVNIPAGTTISASSSIGGIQRTIAYSLDEQVTLLPEATSVYASATSVSAGAGTTIGAGGINTHNFTSYQDYANDSLKVTNVTGIIGGANRESDTNYRYRISNAIIGFEAANRTAIRLAALGVSGVSDVVMLPYDNGTGTFSVYIKSIYPVVSDALVDKVQEAINRVQSFGNKGTSRSPKNIGIQLIVTLNYRKTLTEDQKAILEDIVEDNIVEYINNLDIGEPFLSQQLIAVILDSSEDIKSIGSPDSPFDQISIYKDSRLSDNRIKKSLIKDYTSTFDERVIVEPTLANPITVRSAT